jgi:predicted dehydrogenase
MVRRGDLGEIVKVASEYPQGWLISPSEAEGKASSWRSDPEKVGSAGCLGDIGTHAENLARYITGLEIRGCPRDRSRSFRQTDTHRL